MSKDAEKVLVEPADVIFAKGRWQGLRQENQDYYLNIIKNNYQFKRRGDVETDPSWQQIIPYIVFNFGQQYFTDIGYIDILAQDEKGNFVVLELKKGKPSDQVVGQILRYISWVKKNLCKESQSVSGVIIVGEVDKKLEYSVGEVKNIIKIKKYSIDFGLSDHEG